MKKQKDRQEISSGDPCKPHLGETVELLIEEVQENLMTLTDLSIAMERERVRLGYFDSEDEHTIEVTQVRVMTAFLAVYCRELSALQTSVSEVEDMFLGVLSEHGVNPIVPETWSKSNNR
jgi:hypothetical protein